MEVSDLFMMRNALVDSGFKPEAAEKVVTALENGMASKIDEVMAKWESKWESKMDLRFAAIDSRFAVMESRFAVMESRFDILERDMIIKLGRMMIGSIITVSALVGILFKLIH